MRGVWSIFIKDWKLFLRDRLALALTFIVPVVISTVIGFAVGGMSSGEMPALDVVIADLDNTPQTGKLVEDISELDILDAELLGSEEEGKDGEELTVEELIEEAKDDVKRGYLPALIVIDKGFTAGDEGAKIHFFNDPGQSIQAQIIFQTLIGLSMSIRGRELILPKIEDWFESKGFGESSFKFVEDYFDESWNDMGSFFGGSGDEGGSEGGIGGMMSDEDAAKLGIVNEELVGEGIDNPGYSQAVAGMAVMFAFFTLTHAAANLFEERDSGTLKRLLQSPLGVNNVLIGKTLNITAIASIQIVFLFIAGKIIFGLNIFGDPAQLILFVLATAVMTSGVGLFLASIASSAQSAGGLSTLFILVLTSMGGAMFPSMFMPDWMQTLGKFTPVYYAMKGFQGIFWFEKPMAEQAGLLVIVLLWAVGFMATGIWIFRCKLSVR